jgi:hypothetical protein
MNTDPNWQALDADPDPDPPKWRRIRIQITVCTYPNKKVVRFKLGFQKFTVNNIVKLRPYYLLDNVYRNKLSANYFET